MIKKGKVFKLVIIGDGGVGKTTLTKVFCNNPYIDQIMTIGIDLHVKDVVVDGQRTILQIWDISGQDQFKFLIPDFMTGARAVILAYDRTRPASFMNLDFWLNIIRTHTPKAPIILISTKADRECHPVLNPEKAMEYIDKNQLIGFVKTSAKLPLNVNLPFKRLLEHLYNYEPDTHPINFLAPDEEFKSSPSAELPMSQPAEEAPSPEIIQTSQPIQLTSSSEQESRLINSNNLCNFCNTPLRESQIKLKEGGRTVLCHNCFNYT